MTMSKTILFLGSPRKHGYTTTLAREAGRGAEEAGLEVKEYDLNDSGIRGCQGCYHCRETYGCATKDYLAPMYQDITEARAIIIASPIYTEVTLKFGKSQYAFVTIFPVSSPKSWKLCVRSVLSSSVCSDKHSKNIRTSSENSLNVA